MLTHVAGDALKIRAGIYKNGPPKEKKIQGVMSRITPIQKVTSLEHMKVRIREAVKCVSPEMLDEVWQELDYHLNTYRATRGAHIELMSP
jgi:hypothetical protein